jgi:hypothetical protein
LAHAPPVHKLVCLAVQTEPWFAVDLPSMQTQ